MWKHCGNTAYSHVAARAPFETRFHSAPSIEPENA